MSDEQRSTPTPEPEPVETASEQKPKSTTNRNMIVMTAIVVVLLGAVAWTGSRSVEAAKREGFKDDVAAIAAGLRYPVLESKSLRTSSGRERLNAIAKDIANAGSFSQVTILDTEGKVMADTHLPGDVEKLDGLPKRGAEVTRNAGGLRATAPILVGGNPIGYVVVQADR